MFFLPPSQLQHKLEAFDGMLLGFDGGEWGGGLVFLDKQGKATLLDRNNVSGIVRAGKRVFVFSGLAHMDINEGRIVELRQKEAEPPSVHLLTDLEGAPFSLRQIDDRTVSFLVDRGSKSGKSVYICKSMTDGVVADANNCPGH